MVEFLIGLAFTAKHLHKERSDAAAAQIDGEREVNIQKTIDGLIKHCAAPIEVSQQYKRMIKYGRAYDILLHDLSEAFEFIWGERWREEAAQLDIPKEPVDCSEFEYNYWIDNFEPQTDMYWVLHLILAFHGFIEESAILYGFESSKCLPSKKRRDFADKCMKYVAKKIKRSGVREMTYIEERNGRYYICSTIEDQTWLF